jgi:hypothetical protein
MRNLWAILKRVVAVFQPEAVAELKAVLQRAWDTISIETINKLCTGFARRLILCLESEGQSISRLLGLSGAEQAVYRWRSDNQVQGEWTAHEEAFMYQWIRERGLHWNDLEKLLPGPYGQRDQKPMVRAFSEEGTGTHARYRNDARHSRPNETRNADSGDL